MTNSGHSDDSQALRLLDRNATPKAQPALIRPALDPEEWARARQLTALGRDLESIVRLTIPNAGRSRLAAMIAIVNDMLPDRDARKVTHTDIALLRHAASEERAGHERLSAIADALESYLPSI